ncbi:TLC domain-containing protein [Crucibulum laeve]|uniref:TLC domain-containing protein n=1 Tax=Crucibulum laeve TaxID=68775 RepID=A0A5C3MQF1_9AGAR|nr:TLC domain-containing protein [Crucibulum laeve]
MPPKLDLSKARKRAGSFKILTNTVDDPNHHLTGPFLPQTPFGSQSSTPRSTSPATPNGGRFPKYSTVSPWLRWAVHPASSLKLLLIPIICYLNWELLAPYVEPGLSNPFSHLFLLSGYVPTSSPDDPRYAKSYYDLLFLAYYIVFWSCIRQSLALYVSNPLAKYFGLKREAKIDRFGEQFYAMVYFAFFGAWGYRVMTQLPTFWYKTEYFWIDYPHWDLKPGLKRYYLMQFSYWCQQLVVLLLGLEKPRKDYWELVAHHFVTLWLVGWSYLVNLTFIGNAVYMSMDIPDTFLAFSKLLNYIQWERAKVVSFIIFFAIWTYFRHYLNICILWSVWTEMQPLIPEWTRKWQWDEGVYLVPWMRYQVFIPILLLQFINLFWYFLMVRILIRAITASQVDDDRSDDEDDGAEDTKED